MFIDNITIIISIIVLLLTIASVVANPFFRSIKTKSTKDTTIELPPLTVVVLSQNNVEALDKHLPLIFSQDYAPGFEVVVAAHNDWVIMLNASCAPASDKWLQTIAESIDSNTNLVLGYSNYKDDVKPYRRFIRLREACYYLRAAAHGIAYRSTGANIAFRRSEFISGDGYRGNLQHVYGEYDFIINKFARPYSTAITLLPDSFVHNDCPTKKTWTEYCIANSHVMHLSYITDALFMYINYAVLITTGVFAVLTGRWIALAVAALCLIATIALRIFFVKRKCNIFSEHLSAWSIPFYELSLLWFDILTKLRYIRADKHDFSTHKI